MTVFCNFPYHSAQTLRYDGNYNVLENVKVPVYHSITSGNNSCEQVWLKEYIDEIHKHTLDACGYFKKWKFLLFS